jgi:predicted RNase H-like HicB family nuclease
MTCEIWVRPVENGFVATVLGLPGCAVAAPTRDEAIEKARLELRNILSEGEIVRVEIEGLPQAQERGVGIFADVDDETWNEFLAAMKEYRAQVDADPNIP